MKSKSKKTLYTVLEKIGRRLGYLRTRKGYTTIKDFAADYDLPPVQYWRIEKGKANLTLKTLNSLLAIHEISVEDFFCVLKKYS